MDAQTSMDAQTETRYFHIKLHTPESAQTSSTYSLGNARAFEGTVSLRDIQTAFLGELNLSEEVYVIDIWTNEALPALNDLDLTINDLAVYDCVREDVLTLYVLARKRDQDNETHGEFSAESALFWAAPHWEVPVPQSERDMAVFLSSLCVFTDCINKENLSREDQEGVLGSLYHFLIFKPAINAFSELMKGRRLLDGHLQISMQPAQCAAIAQACFHAFKCSFAIEMQTLDQGVFRISRLFFGYILDQAKAFKTTRRFPDARCLPNSDEFLHNVCGQNGLAITSPHSLQHHGRSVCLTLDDVGFLSVCVGFPAGRTPSQDDKRFEISRPTKRVLEVINIDDVMIKINAILEARRTNKEPFLLCDSVFGKLMGPSPETEELIMICLNTSEAMQKLSGFTYSTSDEWIRQQQERQEEPLPTTRTKLEICKDMIEIMIDKLLVLGSTSLVGFMTFGSDPRLFKELTSPSHGWNGGAYGCEYVGNVTAMETISAAIYYLEVFAPNYPQAKKRIICLSDGNDTSADDLLGAVQASAREHDIVIDSICVADQTTPDFMRLAHKTGGYKLEAKDPEVATAIAESEIVLSQLGRPEKEVHAEEEEEEEEGENNVVTPDKFTTTEFPQLKIQKWLNDNFMPPWAVLSREMPVESMREQRIKKEILEIRGIAAFNDNIDVYASCTNPSDWLVVMVAPHDSIYKGGVFLLSLEMGENYPAVSPRVRFLDRIWHPNISRNGLVSHSFFNREWVTDISNIQLLHFVWTMLKGGDLDSAVNTYALNQLLHDRKKFIDNVESLVREHCWKTREEYRQSYPGQ